MWVKIRGGVVGTEGRGARTPGRVKGGSGGAIKHIELSADPTKLRETLCSLPWNEGLS